MSHTIIQLRSFAAIAVAIAMVWVACAGSVKFSSQCQQMLYADSLFNAGNFEAAKTTYEEIRTTMPPASVEAAKAHYNIGYIDVFYKNPKGDWNAALMEFKSFVDLYPDNPHYNEVNSWIKILTTIKSFETEYHRTTRQVERLKADKSAARENQLFHLDSMAAILRSSYKTLDSLAEKNADLENAIIDLEKKCQQAGK